MPYPGFEPGTSGTAAGFPNSLNRFIIIIIAVVVVIIIILENKDACKIIVEEKSTKVRKFSIFATLSNWLRNVVV